MGTLEIGFKRYYQAQRLAPERLSSLSLQSPSRSHAFFFSRYSLAAMLAVILTGGIWLGAKILATKNLADKVIMEIARNHGKNKEVKYPARDYLELETRLDALGIPLNPEGFPGMEQYALVGGRYCSVDGEPAAQIKLKHAESGDIFTLYVSRSPARLTRLGARKDIRDTVQIRIWNQGGRFFGLAGKSIP